MPQVKEFTCKTYVLEAQSHGSLETIFRGAPTIRRIGYHHNTHVTRFAYAHYSVSTLLLDTHQK